MESIINFNVPSLLGVQQRGQARRRFYSIVEKFKALKDIINGQYNRCLLVQYTYEYARSAESRDMFLHAFFDTMPVTLDGDDDIDFSDENLEEQLRQAFVEFADYLLDNFFLPRKTWFDVLLSTYCC